VSKIKISPTRFHFLPVTFFLTQNHLLGKLAHFLAKIEEHDLMITTTKIIKGCYLDLDLAQYTEPGDSLEEDENVLSSLFYLENIDINFVDHPWYKDIFYYLLHHNFPILLDCHQCRRLYMIAPKCLILGNIIYHRSVDGILLRFIDDNMLSQELTLGCNRAKP
jgi:hypothetical protein